MHLTESQLAVACALLTAPGDALLLRTDARTALAQLRDAGVVTDAGELTAEAAATIRVVALPVVRLEARVIQGDAGRELRVWADERDAVLGHVDGDAVELRPVAWERFPAEVAARIGLAGPPPRHLTGPREPLPVPAALLADVHARLREDDTDGALALLREHGLPPRARGEALAIADQLRLAFTVAASWRDRDGRANAGALGGLEAGTAGWWTFAPEDPGAGLRPSDPEAIASSLLDLLPNGATAS